MVTLEIRRLSKNYRVNKKSLLKIFKRAGKLLKLKNFSVSLVFVDDKTIKELNKKYRFKDKITDVLSFEKGKELKLPKNVRLGEIVISYPEAKRQSKLFKEPLQKVIERLFIHGLLHLAGYEHKAKRDRILMEKKVAKIISNRSNQC